MTQWRSSPRPAKVESLVDCISIFSGAGGLDAGAQQAGARIVAAIEIDHDSTETLRQNGIGTAHAVLETDIREVDFTQWRQVGPNILIGGPPCQPFSKNGYWVRNDNRLIADDPRNMLGQFLRAVSEMQPSGFLFENVDSILHPTNKASLDGFLAVAEELGYTCTLFRAYALDFGIPQRRRRVFVFGIRGKHARLPDPRPTHADPVDPKRNVNLPHYEGVGRFILPFAGDAFREPQEDASAGTYFKELLNVPPGKNYIALSSLEDYSGRTFRSGGRFWNFLFKLHPEMPSITIAAQPGPWVGPFHWDSRRLRVPEIAAIQTFPEGYQFFGNRRSVQRQIGNAVPTLLGRRMIEHLLSHIS